MFVDTDSTEKLRNCQIWAIRFVESIFSFSDAALKWNKITMLRRASALSASAEHTRPTALRNMEVLNIKYFIDVLEKFVELTLWRRNFLLNFSTPCI
jgi:hypothetical protein